MGRIRTFVSKEESSEPAQYVEVDSVWLNVWVCDCSGSVMCGQLMIDVRLGSHAYLHVEIAVGVSTC